VSQAGLISVAGGGGSIQFVENTGSAVPSAGIVNVLGGSGIQTSGSGNTITITATGSGVTWQAISASQTLAPENGYFCVSPGGALSLALPAVSTLGNEIIVSLDGATSFTITQGAGQSIKFGSSVTTTGVGGSLGSTQQGDTVVLVCSVANLRWNVIDSIGNPTVV
jgi:hypothetical protein